MAATLGGDPPVDEPPVPSQTDLDCVITTVVAGNDGQPADAPPPVELEEAGGTVADVPEELLWVVGELNTTRKAALGHAQQLAAVESRLSPLEAVPGAVESLGRATRQELERCAGVLFAHDRAIGDTRQRVDALEARATGEGPSLPAADVVDALAAIRAQLDALGQRLGAVEARVEPLDAVPAVVQALRRAVRASDDLMAGEVAAREREVAALADDVATQAQARDEALRRLVAQDLDRVAGIAANQTQAVEAAAGRLAAAEARLGLLDSVPADIEALSRILRRELDAVTTDNQARDQMLRRALQNEIDQLRAAFETRDQAAGELATRLEVVERRLGETVEASSAAAGTASERLEALEGRMAAADGLGPQLEALREVVRTELEQLRTDARAHDQIMGEITRRFSALDGRLARFDPVPGEVQSLRTALRQEAERSTTQLRVVEERLGQLAWVPGEFQEARKRILALTSGLQLGQDSIRALEAALASTDERVRALGARLSAAPPPGSPA